MVNFFEKEWEKYKMITCNQLSGFFLGVVNCRARLTANVSL